MFVQPDMIQAVMLGSTRERHKQFSGSP